MPTIAPAAQAPTITLSASTRTPEVGASVTFTATFADGVSPSGTVTFKDGAATLGTSIISGTTASFTTTTLAMGSHSVTAVYGGDTSNAAATSAAVSVTVVKAIVAITLSASPGSPVAGAPVTFTATLVLGAAPTGTVTFMDGATTLGTATISGTTASVTATTLAAGTRSITAVYDGDSNNTAATTTLTVTVGKAAPTIAVSASPSNPVLGASVTFTATLARGTAPSGTVTFKDGATTLGTSTISGTTATFTTSTLTVGTRSITAEYGGDTNNTTATSAAVTVTVKAAPAITLSASDINPAVGASVIFTATLTGGASPSGTVTFKDGATTLGTSPISGTTVMLATVALTVGSHSITAEYGGDANNATANSTALTVTVGQAAPTISVSASPSNPALGASVTFTATLARGTAPSGTVTFKDGATTLGTSTISGTTATFTTSTLAVGSHSVIAEYGGDVDNAAATSAPLTVKVAAVAVFTFTPAGGALRAAMAGEDYSQSISATGGTGALTYRLASGALPAGVVLNASTGELTGPLDANAAVKDYSFTIEARDGNGATGTASYSLKVTERVVAVTDRAIDMSAGGAPGNVNLAKGATGGPFTNADVIFTEPANAGTASIVRGEFARASGPAPLGWYLKFVPNPAFSGTARVGFKLTSALGVSNTGTVTYKLGYAPAEVAEAINGLVHGFVQTRQNMIASTIKVPGLLERRQLENTTDPVTTRITPSEEGMITSFSTSLAQMESARDSADGVVGGYSLPFNIWVDGTLMAHNRDENGGKWGGFGMISLGADYLLSEKALIGLSFHYDRMTDPTDEDAELTGNGWLAGPYASLEIGKGVFWDASLLYGGSANDIDTAFWDGSFDTKRWLIDTAIKGAWQLDEVTVLTPQLRAIYFNEKVEDYTISNATGDEIDIDGFDEEQFRVSLGAKIARSFALESGSMLTPKLGVAGGYAGLDGSGAYASLTAGLTLETASFWMFESSLLFNVEGDGQKSVGGRARAAKQF
ncbi:Ig-like domain repeat protein [Mycoplana sp. BE70]|uniref:Ig-like domain repeat protein n=1 Tax=Mycoplana sp. BE70 TaxID=2817775 RepID=UPI00286CE1E8|nr:Ig-like domain repeat protein [Mycoplana sp. BE70]